MKKGQNFCNISLICLVVLFCLLTGTDAILAQPGLPSAPDQAPIDGGLGILAAAGGSYALYKFRNRKK